MISSRSLRLSVFVILASVCFLATVVFSQTHVRVRASTASARQQPNSGAKVLKTLREDDVLEVLGHIPYWYKVRLDDGRVAYLPKILCRPLTPEEFDELEPTSETAENVSELFVTPPAGPTMTIPSCMAKDVSADWNICPTEGPGSLNALANRQKNRVATSCSYSQVSFDQMLALKGLPKGVRNLPQADPRRGYMQNLEARSIVIEGFLAMVKRAEPESTNCFSSLRKDIHIELVPTDVGDPKLQRSKVVVAEVTPWFSEATPAWSLETLEPYASYTSGYSNPMKRSPTRVRIYGWLFFDNWHSDSTIGTTRGTVWEIHPITRMEVFQQGSWTEIK